MNVLQESWQGFLSFTLESHFGKTVVKDKKHFGPLVLQRPYYQELNRPTILVIHPPGGVVAGDQLTMEVSLKENAQAFISTPAATKFYRSLGARSYQTQRLKLAHHSQLEWLPQETLFFNQANVHNRLYFELESAEAELIAWDIVGFGRPAMQESFSQGEVLQKVEISLAGKPVFIDQFYFNDDSEIFVSPFGLNRATLMATMMFYHSDISHLRSLKKELLAEDWVVNCGVTLVNNVLLLRTLDTDLDNLKARLISAWKLARPLIISVPAVMPRIWNT